jgi:Domain of unknown function (DUF4345)
MKTVLLIKNIHLILSIVIVIPVAFVYGFKPNLLFDIHLDTIDETNFFKAIMGLYLAFASLWILGVFKVKFWKIATVSNSVFMLGLAFGRIMSVIFDGVPSKIFAWGLGGEMLLGVWGLYLLTTKNTKETA